jgi:hypothetical protein
LGDAAVGMRTRRLLVQLVDGVLHVIRKAVIPGRMKSATGEMLRLYTAASVSQEMSLQSQEWIL